MVEVKANKNRVWRKLLAFVCAAGLAFLLYQLFYYPIFDTVAGIGYQPSAEMSAVIDNIELTDKGMRILRASRPELQDATAFSQNCPNVSTETSTLGCYYARHIYVFDVDNAELNGIKEAVLAHELLHAVWERSDDTTKQQLDQLLQQTYVANQAELSEHMDSYESAEFTDELHSVIGTQLDYATLDETLRDHYAAYFKNPSKIVAYFKAYDALLTGQRRTAIAMLSEIQSKKAEIERRSAAYEQSFNQLSQDIDNYNYRAGQGYHSESERIALERERNNLIARQTALNQEYDAISALVDDVNRQIGSYNDLVEHLSGLFESIDSSAKPSEVDYRMN